MINAENLWKFITRGATMIMCTNKQYDRYGADVVLPTCITTGNLSSNTVTVTLVQVKNAERLKYNVDKTFDRVNLFKVGLISNE